jgi:hypothetical protein
MKTLILAYLPLICAAGFFIGVAAAAFGIGGGVLNVPLVYFLLASRGVADGPAFKSALATSMFAMFFTSLSAGAGHYRGQNFIRGAIPWLAVGSIAGAQLGASAAVWLPGVALKIVFGIVLLFLAWRMAPERKPAAAAARPAPPYALAALGAVTGVFGAMLGIGGGVLIIPTLCLMYAAPFHNAVGTSSIFIIFTSLSAFARFMLAAPAVSLPYSIGYVNWPIAAALVPGCMLGAAPGVRLMLRANPKPLRFAFATVISLVAFKLLGVFHLLSIIF